MTRRAVQRALTAVAADRPDVSDRDLLRRFADENDQGAFAALVRRHTNLVLGVCRRAVGGGPDADDACQAVFLILARKAGTGRWQPSVANWLYTTARQVARDARVAASRRARREGKAAVPVSPPLPYSYLLRFSPDGKRLAMLHGRDLVRVYDVAGRAPVLSLDTDGVAVSELTYSADGRFLVGSRGSGPAVVWEATGGE